MSVASEPPAVAPGAAPSRSVPLSAQEVLAVLVLMPCLCLGQVALAGALSLFSRHFWSDELYTVTLVGDPDFGHSLQALAGGVETHPPTYYLFLRSFTWLNGANEIALR